MKKILIFGGTQFVGKKLVGSLLEKNYEVTIASRGNWPIPQKTSIKHFVVDRYDPETYNEILKHDWDVIVDQLAFTGFDANLIVDAFKGRVGKILTTTSSAVYNASKDCRETNFNATAMNIESVNLDTHWSPKPDTRDYIKGKRQVEYIYGNSGIPSTFVRFPKIIGLDDLSFRFFNLYKKIKNDEILKISDKGKRVSLINSREAARFLSFCVSSDFSGPINGCLNGNFSLEYYEKKNKREIKIDITESEESLFLGEEILLNSSFAQSYGFSFEDLDNYLVELGIQYDLYLKSL